jgi:hypothetical protein
MGFGIFSGIWHAALLFIPGVAGITRTPLWGLVPFIF